MTDQWYTLSGYTDRDGDGLDLYCLICPRNEDTHFPSLVRRFTDRDMNPEHMLPLSTVLSERDKHWRTAGHR